MAKIIMNEENSTPSTPTSGKWVLYPRADGLFLLDDLGLAAGPMIPASGWIPVSSTWSYASATTITVPSDATTKYKVGMGVRWKQGGGFKYAYIIGVTSTLLTVAGGSDYSVANSAITDVSYSLSPLTAYGFPSFINFTPVYSRSTTNFTNSPVTNVAHFKMEGSMVIGFIDFTMPASAGGSGEVWATAPTNISIGRIDFGQETAVSAQFCCCTAVAGIHKLAFWNSTPAVIATTAGYRYWMNFKYLP